MSSNGLTLDFIGITVCLIQDVLRYKINGYHNLLFNTRVDTDMMAMVELCYISVITLPYFKHILHDQYLYIYISDNVTLL